MEEEENNLKIGVRRLVFNSSLRSVRKGKGLNQKQLAEVSGVSLTRVQWIEQLKTIPTYDEADKIADALQVTVRDILPDDIYMMVVPKIRELKKEVYFNIKPTSLCYEEIKMLKYDNEEIEKIEADVNIKMIIKRYINELPKRRSEILKLRFGLIDGVTRTLEEVGKEFGVTRERIRQEETKGIRTLKRRMMKDGLDIKNIF